MTTRVAINGLGRIGRAIRRRGHRPPPRDREGDDDQGGRPHRVSVPRGWTGQGIPPRSRRGGQPRPGLDGGRLTRVVDGDLVKVMSWYDNEWGCANQMLREAVAATSGVELPGP